MRADIHYVIVIHKNSVFLQHFYDIIIQSKTNLNVYEVLRRLEQGDE